MISDMRRQEDWSKDATIIRTIFKLKLTTARICGRDKRLRPWQLHPGQNQRCESV